MKNNLPKGKLGEDIACNFLKSKGYRILSRNFRCRGGEIDIITIKDKTLVFVEVKTRWGNLFGSGQEAITWYKIKSLIKTAEYYKARNPNSPENMRIDAVIINYAPKTPVQIELITNITG